MKTYKPQTGSDLYQNESEPSWRASQDGRSVLPAARTRSVFLDQRPAALAQQLLQSPLQHSPQQQRLTRMQALLDDNPRQLKQRQLSQRLDAPEDRTQPISTQERELAHPEQTPLRESLPATDSEAVDSQERDRSFARQDDDLVQRRDSGPQPGSRATGPNPATRTQANRTGLPSGLKSGLEDLSGLSLDGVKVHYNSTRPAQLQALAYTQGREIHVGPGQERHLPHEGWHVVQQQQGRVSPTLQMRGLAINDDAALEQEADVMGTKALQLAGSANVEQQANPGQSSYAGSQWYRPSIQSKPVVQRLTGFEVELNVPFYGDADSSASDPSMFKPKQPLNDTEREDIADFLWGGLSYGVQYGKRSGMFDISADHGKYRKTHTKFVNLLLSKGYVTQPGGRFKTMTNMEYRTKALEERDPGSQAKIDRMTKEIQEHANQSVSKSKQDYPTNLPAPVDDCYTAVPMAAFGKLVKGDGEGETALQEVKNAIDPTVYYQTTTGVLPSEVPELFTEAAADIGKTNPAKTSRANVSKTILELAVTMAANVCAQGTHAPLFARFTPGEIGALKGWMTLVAQYLLAYQVEVTGYAFREEPKLGNKLVRYGGTGKNMVAYLSKTPLVNTIAALPPAVRPNVKDGPDKEKWVTLFGNLLLESEKSSFDIPTKLGLSDYAGQNFYDSTGNNPKVIKHDEIFGDRNPRQWLSWTLQGVSVFHVMTGNELTLDAEQDKPTPALTVKGEEAIPLEDRKSQSKQSFGRARDVDKIDRTIKQEWKRAVDRRLASTRDRAEFDELRVKADSFVNKFSTDLDNLTLLKRFEEDFAKIEIDPVDVEKEKQKLDKLIQDCGTQADEAFERAKPILNGKIDDLKTHVTSESDQVSIGELEKRSRQIYDAYNENLYRKINCLKACIELHEQIMQQIETSFENLRKSVIEKSQSISKDKLTESVKGPIKKKYERILTAGPSIQGIKDLKALLERLDL